MNTPLGLIAICACVMGLGACDKTPAAAPKPTLNQPTQIDPGASAGSFANPSVPSAESVFPSANAKADPGKTDGTRKPAQASTGTPMPGQNNDHSAPLSAAKRASSP